MTPEPGSPALVGLSGRRLNEVLGWMMFFGSVALAAAASLIGAPKGWRTQYDDTFLRFLSAVLCGVGALEVVSGISLRVRRSLGWAWVGTTASAVPFLGSLLFFVGQIHDGGLDSTALYVGFFVSPFPILLWRVLSLKKDRDVLSLRAVLIGIALLGVSLVAVGVGFSRRDDGNYLCRDCGAYRELSERLEPFFGKRMWVIRESIEPTPLSRYVTEQALVPPHEHQWLFGQTSHAFGGAAGWKEESDSAVVVAFVDNLFRYRGPDAALWGEKMALRILPWGRKPLSKVLTEEGFPDRGFGEKEAFVAWVTDHEAELGKKLSTAR